MKLPLCVQESPFKFDFCALGGSNSYHNSKHMSDRQESGWSCGGHISQSVLLGKHGHSGGRVSMFLPEKQNNYEAN